MNKKYKKYDTDFKKTLVQLYENGKGVSELSKEYSINESSIREWIKKFSTMCFFNIIISFIMVSNCFVDYWLNKERTGLNHLW